jgi:hypothetical protein
MFEASKDSIISQVSAKLTCLNTESILAIGFISR